VKEVAVDLPKEQIVLNPAMTQCVHPVIVLASIMLMNDPARGVLIAMPDSVLLDTRGRRHRSRLAHPCHPWSKFFGIWWRKLSQAHADKTQVVNCIEMLYFWKSMGHLTVKQLGTNKKNPHG